MLYLYGFSFSLSLSLSFHRHLGEFNRSWKMSKPSACSSCHFRHSEATAWLIPRCCKHLEAERCPLLFGPVRYFLRPSSEPCKLIELVWPRQHQAFAKHARAVATPSWPAANPMVVQKPASRLWQHVREQRCTAHRTAMDEHDPQVPIWGGRNDVRTVCACSLGHRENRRTHNDHRMDAVTSELNKQRRKARGEKMARLEKKEEAAWRQKAATKSSSASVIWKNPRHFEEGTIANCDNVPGRRAGRAEQWGCKISKCKCEDPCCQTRLAP